MLLDQENICYKIRNGLCKINNINRK